MRARQVTTPPVYETQSELELRGNLCCYDTRNPDYYRDPDDEYSRPSPCSCDNCFYGRSPIANQLLEMLGYTHG